MERSLLEMLVSHSIFDYCECCGDSQNLFCVACVFTINVPSYDKYLLFIVLSVQDINYGVVFMDFVKLEIRNYLVQT